MDTPVVLIVVGLLILVSHYFADLFKRTKIPDVLFLFIIGLLVGPVFRLADTSSLGVIGSVFTNVTLVIILFESGIDLDIKYVIKSLTGTTRITVINFFASVLVVSVGAHFLTGLDWFQSMLLGSILGGTSSAVVVGLSRGLNLTPQTKSILIIESALSDIFTLVIPVSLITIYYSDAWSLGSITGQFLSGFVIALLLGIIGGVLWSFLLHNLRMLGNHLFSSIAVILITYGLVEYLGFSGPIAALSFGITLGNMQYLIGSDILKKYSRKEPVRLSEQEKGFFNEVVFILRTFFFVYVGASMQFDNISYLLAGIFITIALYIIRIPVTRVSLKTTATKYDATYTSIMIPKGLGAAILASLPLQQGIPQGDIIQTISFSVIISTTVLTTVMVMLFEKTSLIKVYTSIFSAYKTEPDEPNIEAAQTEKL